MIFYNACGFKKMSAKFDNTSLLSIHLITKASVVYKKIGQFETAGSRVCPLSRRIKKYREEKKSNRYVIERDLIVFKIWPFLCNRIFVLNSILFLRFCSF